MKLTRWLPVLLVLVACGGAGGSGSNPGAAGDATASETGATDGAGGDGTTDGGAIDGTTNGDTGTGDATANDGPPSDGGNDGAGDGAADASVCSVGQTGCAGSTPQACSGGQWVAADASCTGATPACLNGACVACNPGDVQCAVNVAQKCDSTGNWGGSVDCTTTNQTCAAGACTGTCAPGQTACMGNLLETCDSSGQLGSPSDCAATSQTCLNGACVGVCAPGQTQCSGNGVQTCDPTTGDFGNPAACNNLTCVNGKCGALTITPVNQTIDVTYGQQTPTVQYTATINGLQVAAAFSTSSGQLGSVASSTGLLTPSGMIGGTASVSATYQNQTVSTNVNVIIHLMQNGDPNAGDAGGGAGGNGGVGGEGPGGVVQPSTVAVLGGSPTTDGAAWLYPYDLTMWPQGLLAPLLQWTPGTGGPYSAVSVQISEIGFQYQGYFAATATPFTHIPVEQVAWDTMAYSNVGDPVTITLVFAANGQAYGPIQETWRIATGTLKGTVYYNSYGTNQVKNYCCTLGGANFGGATLAIKHGATSPSLVAGTSTMGSGCRVCHSVSADGSTLITQHGDNYGTSSWYALSNYAETTMNPTATGQYAWPAIFPDGSILLADGAPLAGSGSFAAQLFNVQAATAKASTGLPAGLKAGSPVFSPDGKHVAFNFYAGTVNGAAADKVSLAAMDYDAPSATFSNFRVLYRPAAGTSVWPTFMPTNDSVVFELEVQNNGRDWGGTRSPCDSTACVNENLAGTQGELWWVDLATKTAARLDTLNGKGYVPTSSSHANDAVLNYEPTVNPVASGGEAWAVFTTRRLYGNVATLPPYYSDPRYVDLTTQPTPKKLWVAAIDLNATPGTDPSHPAFYLPGQELLAGNSRGYWVVDPCQANGTTCQSGDECCGGYCESLGGGLVCSSQPPACSQLFDKCTVDTDCCGVNLGVSCINGRCAQLTH